MEGGVEEEEKGGEREGKEEEQVGRREEGGRKNEHRRKRGGRGGGERDKKGHWRASQTQSVGPTKRNQEGKIKHCQENQLVLLTLALFYCLRFVVFVSIQCMPMCLFRTLEPWPAAIMHSHGVSMKHMMRKREAALVQLRNC